MTLDRVLEPVELVGKWALPEDSEHFLCGKLRYVAGEQSRIDIFDTYYHSKSRIFSKEVDALCGLCNPLQYVTVFNAAYDDEGSRWNWHFEAESTFANLSFIDAWVGDRKFSSREEVRFKRIVVGINGLHEWCGLAPVNAISQDNGGLQRVEYKMPNPILLFKNDEVVVNIVYRTEKLDKTSSSIKWAAGLEIAAANGDLPFYGEKHSFEYWKDIFYALMGLLIGRHAMILECVGFMQDAASHNEEISVRRLWGRDIRKDYLKPLKPNEIRFPREKINDVLTDVVKGFCEIDPEAISFSGHLVYLQAQGRTMTQSQLPELVYMFEGLEDVLFKQENRRVIDGEMKCWNEMIEALSQGKDSDCIAWLKKKCQYHFYLDNRLHVAMDAIGEAYPYLKQNDLVEKLLKYIKDRRNKYSHGRVDEYYYKGFRLYMFCVFWLWTFIGTMVLFKCGMPLQVIKKCLWSLESDYCETRQNLIKLL